MSKLELNNLLRANPKAEEEKPLVIVRVSTSCWKDSRGIAAKKQIKFLKRKCKGFNFVKEDFDMVGGQNFLESFTNLWSVDDGVYQIVMTNMFSDWETGHLEDWDYKLIPYGK